MDKMMSFEQYCTMIDQSSPCMDDYLFVVDIPNDHFYISPRALKRFQIRQNDFHNVIESHKEFVCPDDFMLLVNDILPVIHGEKETHDISYRWMGEGGKNIWVRCKGRLIRGEENEPKFILGCVNEIGRRQIADNTTGLRQTGDIEAELNQGDFPKGFFMRLGLDGFKNVVERLGMEYGDKVLHDVANCVKSCLAPNQRIFRAISDEFLVIDFSGAEKTDAQRLYRRIRASLDFYIEANGYKSVFTISAGVIATTELQIQNHTEVMKMSRFALNMAKNHGRNQVYLFNQEEYEQFLRRSEINLALRQAIANDFEGFELYYQPIIFAKDGTLCAAESLCRFFIKGKMISPSEFIPILEETGLIIPVGRWIMNQAAAMAKECRQYNANFRLSVNLSYVQVLKTGVTNELMRFIEKHQLNPDAMMVEITESGYLDNSSMMEHVWNHLKNSGVRVALDDFGTGYSNMRYLDKLRPNVLKIDRSFTVEALSTEYANHLLENIIQMAHSMKLMVCMEGVETEEELKQAVLLGADFIQGFYYGRPCNRETFIREFIAN